MLFHAVLFGSSVNLSDILEGMLVSLSRSRSLGNYGSLGLNRSLGNYGSLSLNGSLGLGRLRSLGRSLFIDRDGSRGEGETNIIAVVVVTIIGNGIINNVDRQCAGSVVSNSNCEGAENNILIGMTGMRTRHRGESYKCAINHVDVSQQDAELFRKTFCG